MCSAAALEELREAGQSRDADTVVGSEQRGYGSFGRGAGGIEDNPLDDEGMLLEQLTPLSNLARYRYSVSAGHTGELFLQALADRERAIGMLINNAENSNEAAEGKMRLADAQARLAFLTYLVGAIVGGHVTRVSARAIERLEELNSELAALVFKMVTDSQRTEEAIQSRNQSPAVLIFGFGSNAGWRLELATLYFFRCFQTLYIESRAREDEIEKRGRHRSLELVEDAAGFINLSFMRRGAISHLPTSIAPAPSGANGASAQSSMMIAGAAASSLLPFAKMRALPTASPSLDLLNRGVFPGLRSQELADQSDNGDDDDGIDMDASGGNKGSKDPTPCPSPIVVDELSAAEIAKREKIMNEEANERAAAMQRSIAHRVGVQGGDRALLDIAMRRIFGLLQYAQHVNEERNAAHDESSAPVMLVQRALSVLYQLSVGVTIVHTGRVSKPRLVSSGRLLLESEVIRGLLLNPAADRFPLLREPKHGRARSFLMATLSKLLYTQIRYPSSHDSSEVPSDMFDVNAGVLTPQDKVDERFIAFMKPMTEVADGLLAMAKTNPLAIRRPDLKNPTVGLFRDLRGAISSATAAREYELVFSWFFPERIRLLIVAAQVWNDNFDVMVPLLKLLSELVHNRGSRIVFPPLSPGGLILFREAAKVLVAFCTPQLQALEQRKVSERGSFEKREQLKEKLGNLNNNITQSLREVLGSSEGGGEVDNDPMSMQALKLAVLAMGEESFAQESSSKEQTKDKLNGTVVDLGPGAVGPGITVDQDSAQQKSSRVCVVNLSRMLSGRYALLGTFALFGDTSLLDARRVVLELALSGSPRHVMSFPKMARALIQLLSLLAEQSILSLIDLSSSLFARILACLGEALASSQGTLSAPAGRTIEAIAVFRCKAAAAVHGATDASGDTADPLQRIRAVLNPEHRSRGDTTSLEEYKKAVQLFAAHEQAHPNLFGSLLALIMHTMFSTPTLDSPNQWSIAKPVMPLIFCAPAEFERQRAEFLNAQSSAREPRIREIYDQLFSKLAPAHNNPGMFNVILRNNDTFSKQLCSFCRDLRRE